MVNHRIFQVHVTQDHIKAGKRQHKSACPIANALRDHEYYDIEVHPECTIIRTDPPSEFPKFHYYHDHELTNWINRYDASKKVKPFFFTVIEYTQGNVNNFAFHGEDPSP